MASRAHHMTLAEKQRTTLARRPLAEILSEKSRTAFTTNSSVAPSRSETLLEQWKHTWTNPRRENIREMFQYMFDTRPEFSDDDRWLPVRPLGHGSFGAAGLFEHINGQGLVDDHVVAKYAEDTDGPRVKQHISSVSKEAAIMIQLNLLPDNEGILFLRNFRHYGDENYWLYLLEHCPNMNLEALRLTYKAMRRTIPEAFLWYLFYGFAKGLVNMQQGPFGEYFDPKNPKKGAYVVHRDMKPENIFLGYAPRQDDQKTPLDDAPSFMSSLLKYPHTKIADFGLSEITSNTDLRNTVSHQRGIGSGFWRTPEMRFEYLPPRQVFYPFEKTCFDPGGNLRHPSSIKQNNFHAYTPAGNTFVVGYIMYQMITLDEPEGMHDMLNRVMARKEVMPSGSVLDIESIQQRTDYISSFRDETEIIAHLGQEEYKQQKQILSMLMNWRDAAYSDSLLCIVDACLKIRPEDRIGARSLLANIEKYMEKYLDDKIQHSTNFEEATMLYAKEEDLTQMRPGNDDIYRDGEFWDLLMKYYTWLDLSAGCIRPDLNLSDVPEEAKVFFTPGMREHKNSPIAKRDRRALYAEDPKADIHVFNRSKRRKC